MNARELMKAIVEESGLSQSTIAEKAGYKRATNVSECLRSNNMRVDNMVRILNACGYEVIIRSEKKDIPDRKVNIDVEA